jgi:hypothetical protein
LLHELCLVVTGFMLFHVQVAQAAFDRRQWGEQLLPLISAWQAAVAAAPGPVQGWVHAGATSAAASGSAAGSQAASEGPALLRNSSSLQRRARNGGSSGGQGAAGTTHPVDDFVELELAAAARLLGTISATLTAVQRLLSAAEAPAAAVQVGRGAPVTHKAWMLAPISADHEHTFTCCVQVSKLNVAPTHCIAHCTTATANIVLLCPLVPPTDPGPVPADQHAAARLGGFVGCWP